MAKTAVTRLRLALAIIITTSISFGCASVGGAEAKPKDAPDFTLKLTTGEEVTLSHFNGKPLLLNVGASWCPHCLHEVPTLKEGYDEYKGEVEFLVVFVKSPQKDVEALIKKNGLTFKVGYDPEAAVGKAYGVSGIPVTFFINAQGQIVDEYFGSMEKDELTEKLDGLLGRKK